MKKILLLNGPSLNLLGTREPLLYGLTSLTDLTEALQKEAEKESVRLICKQSNSESQLIDFIHETGKDEDIQYIIFNPAAFTHTSIALRDALQCVNVPFIEVHITNIYGRETFRQHSYFSDIAQGVICGLGVKGYFLALQHVIDELK
ncbi:type II 3-dehydroquinate dehydratase [Legionella israelensis]|uniref:type II 3-dehydroquinate dehydratase n=1 Tax=Legionella israelensis TaxID=454 RepID=UPI0011806E37|nr:type II 3-dehydroquinate dehydratase [Legionella israelensis]QDP71786.1 type II 3-dehydroquinate dehydratase [Legionella israelensis]